MEELVRRCLVEGQLSQHQQANPVIAPTAAPTSSYHSLQPGKVQSIVQQMSKGGLNPSTSCKCGFGDCQCGVLVAKQSTSTSLPIDEESNDSIQHVTNLQSDSGENVTPLVPPEALPSSAAAANFCDVERNRYELEIRNLRAANEALKSEMAALQVQYENLTSIVQELELERQKNRLVEAEIVSLKLQRDSEMSQQMSSYQASIHARDDECQQLKEKLRCRDDEIAALQLKWQTCCEEMEKLTKLDTTQQQRCSELQSELECSRECGLQRLAELHDAKEHCQTLCSEVERYQTQIKYLEMQLDAEMKRTCQLTQELNAVEMAKQCKQQQQSHEKKIAKEVSRAGNCSNGSREQLINAIKDMKALCDAVKRNEIELVDGYERRIEEMQTKHCKEIERMRCSSFKDEQLRNCTCEWSTNDEEEDAGSDEAAALLIRKLHKFGIQSLTAEELHDLHCRVRCAMMKIRAAAFASSTTNAGRKSVNNAEYFRRICDELKAKYNSSDQISPLSHDNVVCCSLQSQSTSNLMNIPERDMDLTSARTAPVLSRTSRGKSSCEITKKRQKRRAKSTNTAEPRRGKKSAECVTISKKIFK